MISDSTGNERSQEDWGGLTHPEMVRLWRMASMI